MKHFRKQVTLTLSLSYVTLFFVYANTAQAMMKFNVKCPKKFVGTVLKVGNSKAPLFSKQAASMLKKVDVTFQNEEIVRGDVDEIVMIQTLKNGPIVFQEGRQYEVEMRENFICSAKAI